MTAYEDAAIFANDGALFPIMTAALVTLAMQVAVEDPATTNHTDRLKLARQILVNPTSEVSTFTWAVSTDTALVTKWVGGNTTGAQTDLGAALATVYDPIAGTTETA